MASTTAKVSRVEAAASCPGKAQMLAGKSVKIRRAAEKKPRILSLPLKIKTIKRFSSIVCRKDFVYCKDIVYWNIRTYPERSS